MFAGRLESGIVFGDFLGLPETLLRCVERRGARNGLVLIVQVFLRGLRD